MRKLLVLLGLCFWPVVTMAITKRALVIGIGNYPTTSGWAQIHGDKDIPSVVELLERNGFQRDHIMTLCNEQATYKGIKSAMDRLVASCQTGDCVYIHFSGHGQQITDMNGDESDGYDEAWIPYDACFTYQKGKYEGQNHLIDDELNGILRRIRARIGKDGRLTIVADACHSGGGTRALDSDNDFVVRGMPVDSLRGGDVVFRIPGQHIAYDASKVNMVDWVMLSACKSYQCNYEYRGSGSLTYALLQIKDQLDVLTFKEVLNRTKTIIKQIIPYTQTPQLDISENQTQQHFL